MKGPGKTHESVRHHHHRFVLPLVGGLLVFLGGHETKAEFAVMGETK
jgi:hypothetical protein